MNTLYWENTWKKLEHKITSMIPRLGGSYPHDTNAEGKYNSMTSDYWTTGFWPGMLWIMYDVTGQEHYRESAWAYDEILESWLLNPSEEVHHDVGFQFLLTAVIKYKVTGDEDGCRRGLGAANFLASRFNPVGKFLRAWSGNRHGWSIIDSMLNVSLLFWASEVTGDARYRHMANQHAETTMTYGIREDGSTKHILSFNAETGAFIESFGGQGHSVDSSWSRGTAWALYGFTNMYRYTGDIRFLHTAKRIAHYFYAALPEDLVPYWDLRLESLENQPRDSSAAAIAASGLLELSELVPSEEKALYYNAAQRILYSLTEAYGTWDRSDHDAILLHATGSGVNYIDCSLIWGDYFYVEAIAKLNGWENKIF